MNGGSGDFLEPLFSLREKSEARNPKLETNSKLEYSNVLNASELMPP